MTRTQQNILLSRATILSTNLTLGKTVGQELSLATEEAHCAKYTLLEVIKTYT